MNKSFSSWAAHLPQHGLRAFLVAGVLAAALVFSAFSFAPPVHAASHVQTASANRSAVAQPAAGTVEGCPSEAACIYPVNAGWNGGVPEGRGIFFTLSPHQLSNELNTHRVFNNQTNNDLVWLCYNADGIDCPRALSGFALPLCTFTYGDFDLTKINSIKLTAFQPNKGC
ncbi:MAG TPA: hypothetical protein VFN35_24075 [Ktedonobacteraceae bacterium]|nr:hypothetical protein [Ktedonobacteraceae bacterium]